MRAFGKNQESRMLALAAIALISLLVRLAPLIRPGIGWATKPDSVDYIHLANGLVAGCGFERAEFGRCLQAELVRTRVIRYFSQCSQVCVQRSRFRPSLVLR